MLEQSFFFTSENKNALRYKSFALWISTMDTGTKLFSLGVFGWGCISIWFFGVLSIIQLCPEPLECWGFASCFINMMKIFIHARWLSGFDGKPLSSLNLYGLGLQLIFFQGGCHVDRWGDCKHMSFPWSLSNFEVMFVSQSHLMWKGLDYDIDKVMGG